MKISRLDVFPIGLPYGRPYGQATGTAEVAKRVVIKVHTDEGIVGLGEASTVLPDRTGESAEAITVILVNHLGPLLIGEDPFQIQQVMQKLRRASVNKYAFPYSKAAVDMALHDIVGKALSVPVAATPEVTDVGYGSPAERFQDDILREPIKFMDGVVHLPEGPGLGVEVDDEKLGKYAIPIRMP